MKIVVNTRFLIKNKLEGMGVFTAETFRRISRNHPDHQFIFLFDRAFDQEFIFSENVKGIVLHPPARHPFLWYIWFEWSVRKFLNRSKADLFISCDGYLPLKSKTKSLTVIHDLAFEHYPKDIPILVRLYYRHFFPKFAKKADRIASVSEFSKKDICEWYSIKPDKIDVVYNGASDHFKPIPEESRIENRNMYADGKEYYIYVGALHQRKNIVHLLKAYEQFRSKSDHDAKLLIVGRKAWGTSEMIQTYEDMLHKSDVIFTGRLSDEELAAVLASALALVYISYFEGFGIPLIEAMHCDVPVITSNTSSLPEVAGNAGILVDPFDVDEIGEAMKKIAENDTFRNDLIEKSRIQRSKFSWAKTAELMWEAILKTQ
ncbi:MAG: glycosyltransferase family 4 protein [Bacteroidetes bacterium]|nr:glycosyltransferase family 4 protein [Bacteroidota bacterium]